MSRRRAKERARLERAARDRPRVLALLKCYGYNATSFQVLEPDFRYWFDGEDACVAYVNTGSAWVAAGAPIAPLERLAEVAERFIRAAEDRGRRVAFFATEQRFVSLGVCDSLLIGEQPSWRPLDWHEARKASRSLREQLRRARAKGVRTRCVDSSELAPGHTTRAAIEHLIRQWLRTRPMAPMGFLVRVHLFEFAEERHVFVAETARGIVGILCAVPVYERDGWFVEDLLRAPDAPNGTNELLFDHAVREAEAVQRAYVTLGLAPLAGPVRGYLRTARRIGRALYDFSGLEAFKSKLRPGEWSPIYLSYPRGEHSFVAVYDSLVAFSRVGLLRFGIASFFRGPAIVVRVLALFLAPWTLALAYVDWQRWFPSLWVQRAWVGFDIALGATLFVLTFRWWRVLLDALLIAIAADACLTFIEVIAFNVRRVHGPFEAFVLCLAVLAPSVATIVLWNARRRVALSTG